MFRVIIIYLKTLRGRSLHVHTYIRIIYNHEYVWNILNQYALVEILFKKIQMFIIVSVEFIFVYLFEKYSWYMHTPFLMTRTLV